MHTVYLKIILCVVLLFTCTILLTSCGNDPLIGKESPDKTKIAIAYTKRFDKSQTHVSVVNSDESIPRKGNVAILKGLIAVRFEWKSNVELNIFIPDRGKLVTPVQKQDGLKINLIYSHE